MANVNMTTAYLLNVPLENDYKNTLYFTSKEKQEEYFQSRMVRTYHNFSYQRKDIPVRLPTVDSNGLVSEYDDLINSGVNYIMYKNSYYTDKWFYAFITDIKYVSDGIVEIEIETDVIQTWLFDFRVKSSFVEREHVSDDTIGKHTIEEGLETGEYTNLSCEEIPYGTETSENPEVINLSDYFIIVATTHDGEEKVTGGMYGGCYSGLKYMAFMDRNYPAVNEFLLNLAKKEGAADAVFSVFLAPRFIVEHLIDENGELKNGMYDSASRDLEYSKPYDHIDGYQPMNNKLFAYPYNFLMISNNAGSCCVYRYEDFLENNKMEFALHGVLCPGCSTKLVPKNYKGIEKNYEEGINGAKFPICNWNTDVYLNWLTQNAVNIPISIAQSTLQMAGGIGMMATGGGALAGAGSIASGGLGIAQTLGEIRKQLMAPPQAEGNINSGDVMYGINNLKMTMYNRCIKSEMARIIDQYFHMFGYKVNRVKVPNKAHRSRFWYTKTIDVNIDGAIPNKDIQKIKDCYNKGITYWRSATEIQDYSLTNEIAITDRAITD